MKLVSFLCRVMVSSVHYACRCSARLRWSGSRGARTGAASPAYDNTLPSRSSRRGSQLTAQFATRACTPQVTFFFILEPDYDITTIYRNRYNITALHKQSLRVIISSGPGFDYKY